MNTTLASKVYSPVRHLASAAFPFSYKDKWMFMLTAYMDETGHPDDPNSKFIGMAGLLAKSEKWEIFENKWQDTLHRFNIPYFHMKDFAHSKGFFEGWDKDEAKRRSLLSNLMLAIRYAEALPFGSIFPLEFIRSYPQEVQDVAPNPYYVAYLSCSVVLAEFVEVMRIEGETVAPVFAEQSQFQNYAYTLFQDVREHHDAGPYLDAPVFRPMRKFNPLQAADLIAYELHKEAIRRYYKIGTQRWGWRMLMDIARFHVINFEPFVMKRNFGAVYLYMDGLKTALANGNLVETGSKENGRRHEK